ncbi:hypothetical protein SDRG_10549 [Saprolegnia diclina VS20]|uniref:Small ribosomal subunit protein mS35 mitochondrial conserved domain-containing protein n=1 Tax=Saprolegnia diclina (strain VS20) TaxID=1156394 RepID=T0QDV2_SAPDV|nr:hypothetical protein SDRG_10549 [Saprolegnia diclina VS20]EQC31760.1 hypothetical protein SDRG_10549 [Saprolegnia diclina VS20]|eukprot:XP_008614767.1 hypothetical protein SDRG_10549 [Saprolegnia diclina VS20]
MLSRARLLATRSGMAAARRFAVARGFADVRKGGEEENYETGAGDIEQLFHTAFDTWEGNDLPEIQEHFENPLWWNTDFPATFDDDMKHEVEMLQVFEDLVPLMDHSWESEIHPALDGSKIAIQMNVTLEDFDNLLFLDDQTTFDTKVTFEVPLSALSLDEKAMEIFLQLAGPRYNKDKRLVKLAEDRYDKRIYNHKRLCVILRDLVTAAVELSKKQQ